MIPEEIDSLIQTQWQQVAGDTAHYDTAITQRFSALMDLEWKISQISEDDWRSWMASHDLLLENKDNYFYLSHESRLVGRRAQKDKADKGRDFCVSYFLKTVAIA